MSSSTTSPASASESASGIPARLDLLAIFGVLSALTLGVGGWLTSLGFGTWYDELRKPPFQPPGWVFGPAWTIILGLLAVGTWNVVRRRAAPRALLTLYVVQIGLNLLWSLAFFTLSRPDWALADILVLDVVVAMMAVAYGRVHGASGWCLVPYVAWLSFASVINFWIVLNN